MAKEKQEAAALEKSNDQLSLQFRLDEVFSDLKALIYDEDPCDKQTHNLTSEIGIRSLALLVEDLTENGNKDLCGPLAIGLTYALSHYADRIGRRAGRKAWAA